jgi:hypothetical protein
LIRRSRWLAAGAALWAAVAETDGAATAVAGTRVAAARAAVRIPGHDLARRRMPVSFACARMGS